MDPLRLPPQNLDAELAAIGGMLLDRRAIFDVADVLAADDFYRDSHQVVFRAIMALHDAGSPVDAVTLVEELRRRGDFEKAGCDEVIRKALEDTPSAANAGYHAKIVRQKAIARSVVESANETLREVASGRYTSDELIDRAERRIFAIGGGRRPGRVVAIGDVLPAAMTRIFDRAEGLAVGGLATGYADLDSVLGGLSAGSMVVLAARPSMGKTAMALGIASHAASRGVGSLFFSLEMGESEIVERLLSDWSGVSSSRLKAARFLTDGERQGLATVAAARRDVQLWLDDSGSPTATQVASTARRFKAQHDVGLLVVDYLQLVAADDEKAPRQEQVAATSRRLKALAKELGVPILVLAQLNRQSERREDRRPMLSDLRESGQIEQDADVVLLLHRPEYYDPNDKPGMAEVIVAKNRNGATARVDLVFQKEVMRFSDVEHHHEAAF
jgi:replicative DNA helicase